MSNENFNYYVNFTQNSPVFRLTTTYCMRKKVIHNFEKIFKKVVFFLLIKVRFYVIIIAPAKIKEGGKFNGCITAFPKGLCYY